MRLCERCNAEIDDEGLTEYDQLDPILAGRPLAPKARSVLALLYSREGTWVSSESIITMCWRGQTAATVLNVRVEIWRCRKVLRGTGRVLDTSRGYGLEAAVSYRLARKAAVPPGARRAPR